MICEVDSSFLFSRGNAVCELLAPLVGKTRAGFGYVSGGREVRLGIYTVVGSFGQPPAQVALGKPASPAYLEHLVEVELVHGEDNEKTGEPGEANQLVKKDCVVLVLQGVIERVIPLIEKDIDIDGPEVERDDGEQKTPRCPAVLREPEWMSHRPSITKDLAQACDGERSLVIRATERGCSTQISTSE